MSWISDFISGSKPNFQLPGYAQGFYDQLKGYLGDTGLGKPGHEYKSIIKKYNQDPASLATMSIARGGVNARQQSERAGQGANALIGAGSGEQANLLHHQMETERSQLDENTALNAIGESQQKYFGALGGLQDSINSRRSAEMGTLGMMGNTLNMGRDMRRSGGLFNPAAWGEQLRNIGVGALSRIGG